MAEKQEFCYLKRFVVLFQSNYWGEKGQREIPGVSALENLPEKLVNLHLSSWFKEDLSFPCFQLKFHPGHKGQGFWDFFYIFFLRQKLFSFLKYYPVKYLLFFLPGVLLLCFIFISVNKVQKWQGFTSLGIVTLGKRSPVPL